MGGASPPFRSPYHAERHGPSRARYGKAVAREGRSEELDARDSRISSSVRSGYLVCVPVSPAPQPLLTRHHSVGLTAQAREPALPGWIGGTYHPLSSTNPRTCSPPRRISTATPCCELYPVKGQAGWPDVIRVTELWRSQDDLDASIEKARGSDQVASPMGLVKDWEMIELEQLGAERDRAVKARSGASCG
jgi:hypothetical protein